MSWLGLDFGSTNLKAAIFNDGKLQKKIGKISFTEPLPDNLKDSFNSILLSSSKSEGTTNALLGGLSLNKKIVKVSDVFSEEDAGIQNYGEPSFGEDRRLYFLALNNMFKNLNFGVVSLGTVSTFSVWSEGVFCGGHLFPGRSSIYQTLGRVTSLEEIEPKNYISLGAGSTSVSSLRCGIDMGWIATIQNVRDYYDSKINKINWVVTGGEYDYVKEHIQDQYEHEPDLLWKGMEILISRL